MTRPIFLIGFMACGKTAVGRRVAHKLKRHLIDLDQKIERRAGRRIHEIIRLEGEEAFRIMESAELKAAAGRTNAVVATGGGVVMREENRTVMERSGPTIWLDLPFDECWRRIEHDRTVRPLAPTREAAITRWNERRDLYGQCKLRIELDGSESAESIAEQIIERLGVWSTDAGGVKDRSQGLSLRNPWIAFRVTQLHPGGMRETTRRFAGPFLASLRDAIRHQSTRGFEDSTPGYVLSLLTASARGDKSPHYTPRIAPPSTASETPVT